MSKYLQDPEYLFSILTMLVKKNDGKIVITEEEMKSVSTGDLIGMYYELKEVDPEDMMQATSIIRKSKETQETYEN